MLFKVFPKPSFWFVTAENPGSDNLKSSMVIPSPTIIDRVLKDLFHEGTFYLCLYWLLCNVIRSHVIVMASAKAVKLSYILCYICSF